MRLYLASFRHPQAFREFAAIAGGKPRVGVISNAVDFIPADARAEYARSVFDPLAALAEAGARAEDFDLRRYFGDEAALEAALDRFDAVWVTGGNVFLLMTAIRRSGFERAIRPRLAATAEGYRSDGVLEGLGLVDFRIVPHFGSDHPEAAAAGRVQATLAAKGLAHRTLRDDEALVVRGGDVTLRRF